MEQNRSKLSEFLSEPFHITENSRNFVPKRSAEEKNARKSVPWIKHRSKLSEFRSEACRTKTCCLFCLLAGFFVKQIFFMPFSFVPSLGIDSSVNLEMPRNDHFLPQNNGSHSKIPLPTLIQRVYHQLILFF